MSNKPQKYGVPQTEEILGTGTEGLFKNIFAEKFLFLFFEFYFMDQLHSSQNQ